MMLNIVIMNPKANVFLVSIGNEIPSILLNNQWHYWMNFKFTAVTQNELEIYGLFQMDSENSKDQKFCLL